MNNQTNTTNPYKVGDIVYISWGYSMTIVQFYEVTKTTKCKVGLRELKQKEDYTGYLSGVTVPVLGEYEEHSNDPYSVSPNSLYSIKNGGVRIPDYPGGECRSARKWNGTPKTFNYCD